MTILKIYTLEDHRETSAVSTLPEGEHVLGRGDLLNCNDKKVSRRHALIHVDRDGATITSVHVNPCFFRPSAGSIKILPRDQKVPLKDNDQFALLATTFWFKVKVVRDSEDNDPNLENEVSSSTSTVSVQSPSCKRGCESPSESNKRQKTSDGDETSPNDKTMSSRSNEIRNEENGDGPPSTSNRDATSPNNKIMPSSSSEIPNEENGDGPRPTGDSLSTTKKELVSDDEEILLNYFNAETQPIADCLTIPVKKEEVFDGEEDLSNNQLPSTTSAVNQGPAQNDSMNAPSSSDVKDEPADKNTNNSNNDQSTSDNMDGSTNQPPLPRVWRDRCWYGISCYRKNPQHRTNFSHPGDNDYDSDPEDDRPLCPFEPNCYRVNIDHRRQFKHSGKPGPRPTTSNVADQPKKKRAPKKPKVNTADKDTDDDVTDASSDDSDTNPGDSNALRQKRKVALKKKKYTDTPEDDYDFQDPFIDDASSDEFQPSGAEDDSDWDDSQQVDEESQDTRRLLKEAKKFTKNKKK